MDTSAKKEMQWVLKKIDAVEKGRAREFLGVIVFMTFVLTVSASICGSSKTCSNVTIFAIIWSFLSMVISMWIFVMWKEIDSRKYLYITFVLAGEISLGTGIVTILGPFDLRSTSSGVGFFGSWIALVLAWAGFFSTDPRTIEQ